MAFYRLNLIQYPRLYFGLPVTDSLGCCTTTSNYFLCQKLK